MVLLTASKSAHFRTSIFIIFNNNNNCFLSTLLDDRQTEIFLCAVMILNVRNYRRHMPDFCVNMAHMNTKYVLRETLRDYSLGQKVIRPYVI